MKGCKTVESERKKRQSLFLNYSDEEKSTHKKIKY